jgi:hypothetical protein
MRPLSDFNGVDIFTAFGTTYKDLLDERDRLISSGKNCPCKIILPRIRIMGCFLEFGDVKTPTLILEEDNVT